jgi:predicted acyl esterase
MRDGVVLATDVHIPAGDATAMLPVILRRTPYGRALDDGFVTAMGALGYAVVSQDVRGRGDSAGRFLPFFDDWADGPDTIAWIAAQPWSNGRVGTWGGSAEGIVQLMALPDAPEALRCANVLVATADVYDGLFPGGAWRDELTTAWLHNLDASDAYSLWRAHEAGDAWWDPARLDADEVARVRVPVLLAGGFYDIFASATPRTHGTFQAGAAPNARSSQYLVLGPWTHGALSGPDDRSSPLVEGEVSYPNAAGYRDLWWDFIDFFDWCLQDGPRPVWSPVRYALTRLSDDGRTAEAEWRTTDAWPPAGLDVPMYLRDDGSLQGPPPPADGIAADIPVDPATPIPSKGGGNLTTPAGPFDQAAVDALPGVLTARTAVATTPVQIEGNVRAAIWASSSSDDGDVVVRLSQVTPSGRILMLADGVRRGRFVGGTDVARPLVPGTPTRFDVDVGPVAFLLPPGHAIQVSVAGTSAPRYQPNPGTSAPLASDPALSASTLTIYRDAAHPSGLTLPVTAGILPGAATEPTPDDDPPDAAVPNDAGRDEAVPDVPDMTDTPPEPEADVPSPPAGQTASSGCAGGPVGGGAPPWLLLTLLGGGWRAARHRRASKTPPSPAAA